MDSESGASQQNESAMWSKLPERIDWLAHRAGGKNALSRLTRLSSSAIADYTNGKRSPGHEALVRIVSATACDAEWLLTGAGVAYPMADPSSDPVAANAIVQQAWQTYRSVCKLLLLATPFADGNSLPDPVELAALLEQVRATIVERRSELSE